jgi:hypothetical protein
LNAEHRKYIRDNQVFAELRVCDMAEGLIGMAAKCFAVEQSVHFTFDVDETLQVFSSQDRAYRQHL